MNASNFHLDSVGGYIIAYISNFDTTIAIPGSVDIKNAVWTMETDGSIKEENLYKNGEDQTEFFLINRKGIYSFEVFPNPSSNMVNIVFTNGKSQKIDIWIYDQSGKFVGHVFSGPMKENETLNQDYSIKKYGKGIYYLVIEMHKEGNSLVKKVAIY